MSRQIGLRNIYVSTVISDTSAGTVYSTPVKLERAIKATLKPKSSTAKIYSDDNLEDVLSSFDGIDVTIEINQLSLESRALLQGSKLMKGQLVENKNDIAPVIALGFESKKANGAARFCWLYKGQFSQTDDNFETVADKPKDQTSSLTGTFYARDYDSNYRIFADSDAPNADLSAIGPNWYMSVVNPPVGGVSTIMTVVAGMTYIVTSITGTVITMPVNKTVASFKTAIQTDLGKGTFKVWSSAAKTTLALDTANVVNTMVVEAIAENGISKATYTIATVV